MNLHIADMMYRKYCIVTDKRSLNVQSNLHFQVVKVQVLLLVEEVYLLHSLTLLRGLQMNCYRHIDYNFQHPGVVGFGNPHLCSYG